MVDRLAREEQAPLIDLRGAFLRDGRRPEALLCADGIHPSELGQLEYGGDDKNFMGKYDPWIRGGVIPNVRMP